MVRNEIDIIDIWLDHLLSIFDHVIIIDHCSNDGTREYLAQRASSSTRLCVEFHDENAHKQSELMTEATKKVSREVSNGWLFFMDADEFIMGMSPSALRRILARRSAAASVRFSWANCYLDPSDAVLTPQTTLKGWRTGGRISKSALNLRFASGLALVKQGNHGFRWKKRPFLHNEIVGSFVHLPVRTPEQLQKKLQHAIPADLAASEDGGGISIHWHELSSNCDFNRGIELKKVVFEYGMNVRTSEAPLIYRPNRENIHASLAELVAFDAEARG
jgi:Glycosyl transferase family 2.